MILTLLQYIILHYSYPYHNHIYSFLRYKQFVAQAMFIGLPTYNKNLLNFRWSIFYRLRYTASVVIHQIIIRLFIGVKHLLRNTKQDNQNGGLPSICVRDCCRGRRNRWVYQKGLSDVWNYGKYLSFFRLI